MKQESLRGALDERLAHRCFVMSGEHDVDGAARPRGHRAECAVAHLIEHVRRALERVVDRVRPALFAGQQSLLLHVRPALHKYKYMHTRILYCTCTAYQGLQMAHGTAHKWAQVCTYPRTNLAPKWNCSRSESSRSVFTHCSAAYRENENINRTRTSVDAQHMGPRSSASSEASSARAHLQVALVGVQDERAVGPAIELAHEVESERVDRRLEVTLLGVHHQAHALLGAHLHVAPQKRN